jgi:uncharacterized SAM-binding protein YcdF (DUF218 family)
VLAGSYPDRILEAVSLYKEGWAPRILICREPDTAGFRRVAELGVDIPRPYDINRMVAERLGVPPDAIEVLDRAGDSTYGEAEVVLAVAVQRHYRSILLSPQNITPAAPPRSIGISPAGRSRCSSVRRAMTISTRTGGGATASALGA